jgi:hypothetical protein
VTLTIIQTRFVWWLISSSFTRIVSMTTAQGRISQLEPKSLVMRLRALFSKTKNGTGLFGKTWLNNTSRFVQPVSQQAGPSFRSRRASSNSSSFRAKHSEPLGHHPAGSVSSNNGQRTRSRVLCYPGVALGRGVLEALPPVAQTSGNSVGAYRRVRSTRPITSATAETPSINAPASWQERAPLVEILPKESMSAHAVLHLSMVQQVIRGIGAVVSCSATLVKEFKKSLTPRDCHLPPTMMRPLRPRNASDGFAPNKGDGERSEKLRTQAEQSISAGNNRKSTLHASDKGEASLQDKQDEDDGSIEIKCSLPPKPGGSKKGEDKLHWRDRHS